MRWHRHGGKDSSVRCNGGDWLLDMADDKQAVNDIVEYMAALPYAIEIETDEGLVGIVHANVPVPSWAQMVRALEQENRDGPIRRKVMWDRSRWTSRRAPGFASIRHAAVHLFRRIGSGWAKSGGHVDGVAAVIVGHTPTREPLVRGNVINIDTGLVYGGNLTLLGVDEIPMLLSRAAPDKRMPSGSKPYPAGSGA